MRWIILCLLAINLIGCPVGSRWPDGSIIIEESYSAEILVIKEDSTGSAGQTSGDWFWGWRRSGQRPPGYIVGIKIPTKSTVLIIDISVTYSEFKTYEIIVGGYFPIVVGYKEWDRHGRHYSVLKYVKFHSRTIYGRIY